MILVIGGAYQGKRHFVQEVLKLENDKVFFDFHLEMKRCIEAGKNADELIEHIFSGGYDAVVSDEIGCGIVPLEKSDRLWREETGRALCKIAAECDEVWRVQCGIGTGIKG